MSEVKLTDIHGKGSCHICGFPKAKPGSPICSYPHAMWPVAPVSLNETGGGFWTWKDSDDESALEKEGGE